MEIKLGGTVFGYAKEIREVQKNSLGYCSPPRLPKKWLRKKFSSSLSA